MITKKSIVFINQDSGYLTTDIINSYAEAGYSCTLITGRLIERNIPLHPSVQLVRIIKYDRSTTFKRLWTWVIGFLQIWMSVIFKFRKQDLFIISNPPLAPLLPLLVRNPFQLLIFDIYPDALSELGYLSENSITLRWWRSANKKVFSRAKHIFTITGGMKQVLQKYAGDKWIEVVPVWTDNTFLKPVHQDENPFILKHQLSGKFIVMYSGNIGLAGDVDILLDVAAAIKNERIIFLVIGEGAKKEMIKEKAERLHLKNIVLLPWQPGSELPYSLSAASLAVIFLGMKASRLAVPSKLYNFLSVGAPLLCVTSSGSEVERLVTHYKCGKCFDPGNIDGIVNLILEAEKNIQLYNRMKENSLKASEDFGVSNRMKFLATTHYDGENN